MEVDLRPLPKGFPVKI